MASRPMTIRTFVVLSVAILLAGTALALALSGTTPAAVVTQPQRWHLALVTLALAGLVVLGLATALIRVYGRRTNKAADIFHSFIEASSDAMAIMDTNGRILCVNRRMETLLGYPQDELVTKPIEDYLVQDRRSQNFVSIQIDFFDTSTRVPGTEPELVARCKDGRRVPVEVTCSPLELEDRMLSISILRDITIRRTSERRRALRHIVQRILSEAPTIDRASPELMKAIGECLRAHFGVFWTVDPAGAALRCLQVWHRSGHANPAFDTACRDAVLTRGAGLPGRVWATARPAWITDIEASADAPHLAPAQAASARAAFAFPIVCGGEVLGVIECFRGDPLEVDDRMLETLGTIGSQLGRFIKQKHAEEAVRESEARKAAVLEAALDAIITVDAAGKVVEFNPTAAQLFGYTPAQAVGQELAALIFAPEQTEQFRACLAGCASAADGDGRAERVEMLARCAAGKALTVEVAVTPIRSAGQALFTSFIRDISDRKRAEEALVRTEEQLRRSQKMEAIGRLAGGIAHDFNNLLTVINGYSEQLVEGLTADDPWHAAADEIFKAGQRATTLTRQLLAFSRKQVLEPRPFDLNRALKEMKKMLRRVIGEDINLVSVMAPDVKPIKADLGQIEQVIMNLVVNARDAMPDGGKLIIETANVTLDESYAQDRAEVQPGDYVLLAVTDTGCGMTEEVKARIFEPFFTTKEFGKGTGLGLATVYGIIKQSGGHLTVYSEPGHGTTFKVYLPVAAEGLIDAPMTVPDVPALVPTGSETVLLVEDEDMLRTFTKQVLQKSGYTVLEARHGAEALDLYMDRLDTINLTVTDVIMPEMNGRQLAEQLLCRQPKMKILYMSGYTDNVISSTGLLEEGKAFIEKPFTPFSLAGKIRELLTA
jgi:two-component system, cell cycle sensor histidine kinase and response regulator CckA